MTRLKSTTGELSSVCCQPTGGEAGGEIRNCWVLLGRASVGAPIRIGYRDRDRGGERVMEDRAPISTGQR